MKENKYYDKGFFTSKQVNTKSSAATILPYIKKVVNPASVIDIGCGLGSWLKVWEDDLAVKDIQGIEGPYISKDVVEISPDKLLLQDLKQPVNMGRKYDLCMSLEVAEHLPSSHAEKFIDTLTSLSDTILFSAAIIGQGGTYHINEQMPEYWATIFSKKGYIAVDYLRPIIWGKNDQVNWWYQQNILLFIKNEKLAAYPELQSSVVTNLNALSKVHPKLYLHKQFEVTKVGSLIGYIRWRLYPIKEYFANRSKK